MSIRKTTYVNKKPDYVPSATGAAVARLSERYSGNGGPFKWL